MKNKKIFTLFLSIGLIFLFSIGFSIWYIIYSFNAEITLSYSLPEEDLFNFENNYIYNGKPQYPITNRLVNYDVLYEYCTQKNKQWMSIVIDNDKSGPTGAGDYYLKVTAFEKNTNNVIGFCIVKVTISPILLHVDEFLSFTHSDIVNGIEGSTTKNYRDKSFFDDYLKSLIKVSYANIESDEYYDSYAISELTNGDKTYTFDSSTSASGVIIPGSTYELTIKLANSNYQFLNTNGTSSTNKKIIVKYKTALIGESFFTIEEAINEINYNPGTITLAGDASSSTSYVETSFTKLNRLNLEGYNDNLSYTISSESVLLVPFEKSLQRKAVSGSYSSNVYSTLRIPSNVTLNFDKNSSMYIGSFFASLAVSKQRGVVVNDGVINVKKGCKLYSYGYLKGTGNIKLESGSIASDVLTIYDWPGGSAITNYIRNDLLKLGLSSSYEYPLIPFNAWSIHNISCNMEINANAKLLAYSYVNIKMDIELNDVVIIGDTNSTNYLFKNCNTSSENYIIKKSLNSELTPDDNRLSSITGSNQVQCQKDKIEIYGNYTDGNLLISLNVNIGEILGVGSIGDKTILLKTSTSKSLPLAYLDVNVKEGAELILNSSDYLFLPGTSFNVEESAMVYVGKDVDLTMLPISKLEDYSSSNFDRSFIIYCVDKKDSVLNVNGNIICFGNLGGTVSTTSNSGSLDISNFANTSGTFKFFVKTTESYVSDDISVPLKGNINSNTESSSYFEKKFYSSVYDDFGYFVEASHNYGDKLYVEISDDNNAQLTVKDKNGNDISADYYDYGTDIYITVSATSGYKDPKVYANGVELSENNGIYHFTLQTHTIITSSATKEDSGGGGGGSCIPSGTSIILADGSIKKVEDLTLNDLLLVYNHETGKFEASPIVFIDDDGWTYYDIVNLKFSNGTITRLIYEHGYFDVTLNKYVYIDEYNYRDYIGHEFVYTNGSTIEYVTLVDSYITNEYVGCYSPVTAVHLNYIVDGMLSMPGGIDGIFNIFEYGEGLKYDESLMQQDIEKYGLMEYEALADYVPYEMFYAFNAKYFNVAIGKGLITFDEIISYVEKYLSRHGLDNPSE